MTRVCTAPVFPLDGVFLCPGLFLPLHVFEPRYRDMLAHALDGDGRIAMAVPRAGRSVADEVDPPLHEMCGLGEIVEHQILPDGRAHILLRGETRARILEELPKVGEFRMVRAEEVREVIPDGGDFSREVSAIHDALGRVGADAPQDLGELSLQQLVDAGLAALPLPRELKLELFDEPRVAVRLRRLVENLTGRIAPDIDIHPGDPRLN